MNACGKHSTFSPETNKDMKRILTLNNGVVIPQFGLGVYSIPEGEVPTTPYWQL